MRSVVMKSSKVMLIIARFQGSVDIELVKEYVLSRFGELKLSLSIHVSVVRNTVPSEGIISAST